MDPAFPQEDIVFEEVRLEISEIVRALPGRRLVVRGQWKGRYVYAKLFFGKNAKRYHVRDHEGVQLLLDARIPTPELLYVGLDATAQVRGLVFGEVKESVNLEDVWNSPDFSGQIDLMKAIVLEVARHHKAGLVQTDLYLKNFLLQGKNIFTLDGDAIRKLPRLSPRQAALKNLALLLSKFDATDEAEWLPELLAIYARERGWADIPDIGSMRNRVAAIRRRVAEKYAGRKVFRECTEVTVSRQFDRYVAVARRLASPALMHALEEPDRLLEEAQSQRLKSGNTCTVAVTEIDSRKLVIKRYNIKSFWHGLNRALRQSRAAVSWSNAYRLKMHDIATAAPVALVEKRFGYIRRQAYFLAEYVDAPDISMFFAVHSMAQEVREMVANEVARLFWKLNLLGISHGDFKATNVKIAEGQPLLIDLDSLRQHRCRWLFERRHVRDLRRFRLNWQRDSQTKALLADALKKFYKDPRLLQQSGWL
jgi:tRNA A-37 threonylcarbamoyl transferase component Bud32